jgi:hypothetical protein
MNEIYQFAFKGLLAEEALDRAGRQKVNSLGLTDQEIASTLAIHALDEVFVADARKMAIVYTAVAAFENSVRNLVRKTLIEEFEEDWWEKGVTEKIRKQAESRMLEEQKIRWHGQRGGDPVGYTMLPNLIHIIQNNFELFTPLIPTVEWARNIFDIIERSRNVVMHSGFLGTEDVERLGIYIRDWTKQVGS